MVVMTPAPFFEPKNIEQGMSNVEVKEAARPDDSLLLNARGVFK